MCGRFTLTAHPQVIQTAFDLKHMPARMDARYNIAPTQPIAVITNEAPDALTFLRWGLVPSWADDVRIGNKLINARAETAHEKPSFRAAFKRRRCLIPADGFYEWQKSNDGKIPHFIHLHNREVFAIAGLWEIWQDADGNELRTCTLLTTEANALVQPLHNRMPVILHRDDHERWLDTGEAYADGLRDLLRPYDAERMTEYAVAPTVNSPATDVPELIEPAS